jgi:hypothetical protein
MQPLQMLHILTDKIITITTMIIITGQEEIPLRHRTHHTILHHHLVSGLLIVDLSSLPDLGEQAEEQGPEEELPQQHLNIHHLFGSTSNESFHEFGETFSYFF